MVRLVLCICVVIVLPQLHIIKSYFAYDFCCYDFLYFLLNKLFLLKQKHIKYTIEITIIYNFFPNCCNMAILVISKVTWTHAKQKKNKIVVLEFSEWFQTSNISQKFKINDQNFVFHMQSSVKSI